MKRLASNWQDMYRTKFVVLEKLPSITNMSNVSQADVKILEVQAKFKVCTSLNSLIYSSCLRSSETWNCPSIYPGSAILTVNLQDTANKTKAKIDTIEQIVSVLAASAHLEQQATKLAVDVAVLEKRHELELVQMDSHWTCAAFDEMMEFMWPQGNPDTQSGNDTAADNMDGDDGNQLGGRGGGTGTGGCAVM